jgi:hypothetical protein
VGEGTGIPATVIGQRLALPIVLAQLLMMGEGSKPGWTLPGPAWEALKPMISGANVATLCQPIMWRKKAEGALLAWRAEQRSFTAEDNMLVKRLAGMTSLALHAL